MEVSTPKLQTNAPVRQNLVDVRIWSLIAAEPPVVSLSDMKIMIPCLTASRDSARFDDDIALRREPSQLILLIYLTVIPILASILLQYILSVKCKC